MKKQLLWALVALGVSVGYLIHDERTSAQTEKPAVADRQDKATPPITAPTQEITKAADAPAPMPAPQADLSQASTSTTTATPTQRTMPLRARHAWRAAQAVSALHVQHVLDFDGDGKTDFSIIRDLSNGTDPNSQVQWWIAPSSNPTGAIIQNWGVATGDQFLTGDFDGDHKADLAVWRQPQNGNHAAFWILRSSDGTAMIVNFGLDGDIPFVVGDYDGDGKDDVAVYRPDPNPAAPGSVPSEWWFEPTAGPNQGHEFRLQWGLDTDIPIPGDFNGDGKADMAVARDNGDTTMTVWIHFGDGTDNPNTSQLVTRWGLNTDFYVPGDYDGDGTTDLAIVRSNGTNLEWWIQWSSDKSVHVAVWGLPGDLLNAVQGDYDGDGKTDIGIWRSSDATFYIIGSATGTPIYRKWGNAGSTADAATGTYNEH